MIRIAILLTLKLYDIFYLRVVSEDSDVLIPVQRLLRSSILTRQCPETKFCSQFVRIIASSAWIQAPRLFLSYQVDDSVWTTENDYCSVTKLVYFVHNKLINSLINETELFILCSKIIKTQKSVPLPKKYHFNDSSQERTFFLCCLHLKSCNHLYTYSLVESTRRLLLMVRNKKINEACLYTFLLKNESDQML
jgi:hypothetical protein